MINGEKRQMSIIQGISKVQMTKVDLPSAAEMIDAKMNKIFEQIMSGEISEKDTNVLKLATRLIEEGEQADVLTSVLKYFLKDELKAKKYEEIKSQRGIESDPNSTDVRLFVARERKTIWIRMIWSNSSLSKLEFLLMHFLIPSCWMSFHL